MGKRMISGSSFSMNHEINVLARDVRIKATNRNACPDQMEAVPDISQSVSAMLPNLLGAIPVSAGLTGAGGTQTMAAIASVCTSGKIAVSYNPNGAGFLTSYPASYMRITNGAYGSMGKLTEDDIKKQLLMYLMQMLQKAGPAYSQLMELLKHAMEDCSLLEFMKGLQSVVCAITGDPINANTGNFLYEKEDLTITGRQPLCFKRFYNRIDTRTGCMGKGWRHNHEIELLIEEDRYVIIWEDGREEIYLRQHGQSPEALFGCFNRLEETRDGFSYKTQEGLGYFFNENGQLTKTSDKNGQGLRYLYDKEGWVSQVSNRYGASLSYHYESGRLTRVTDHSGRSIILTYEFNRLSQVTNALGQSYCYYYDKDNAISKIKNPRNVLVLNNEYDDRGRTVRQQFADGGVILYDYQDDQSRTLMTEQNGNRIAYVRDEKYRNIQTIYMDGEESFVYNDRNQRIQCIDKNGNKTRFSYDDKGNIAQVLYPDGSKHNMTYNADNRLLVMSVNGKTKVRNIYDSKGSLISTEDALGRKRTFIRDEDGAVCKMVQADGSKLTFTYDNRGNICNITDVYGNTTGYQYDELNRVVKSMDRNGNQTEYQYDAANQLKKVINAKGDVRSYDYTKNGKITRVIDFNGAVTSQEYNDMNQVKNIIMPNGGITKFEYDQMQNVTRRVLPTGAEFLYAYDPLNRMEQMTLPTGGAIRYEYDPNGNRTAVIDANGNRTTSTYDELNRVTAVTEADGATTEYEYDMDGNLVCITNAAGQSHTYCYDEMGQKVSETDILGNTVSYEYNEMGKVTCITDPRNQNVWYKYGTGGILEEASYPDGTSESYTYDSNGNLIRRENQRGDYLEFQYDCLDRMIKMSGKSGQEQRYTYNAVGNVTSVTDANGNQTRYEYSPDGNLIAVIDAAGHKTEYAYDGMSNLTTVFRHRGAETLLNQDGSLLNSSGPYRSGPLRLTRYERDGLGKITKITDPLGYEETFEYDLMGQMVAKTDKEGYRTVYAYTPFHKLEQVTYNDGRSVEYTYNALRQLIQVKDWLGITNVELDAAGRAEKITDYAGREVLYQWSRTGEREAICYPDGRKVAYEYNDQGRLSHLEDGVTAVDYQYTEDGLLAGKYYKNDLQTMYSYDENGLLKKLTHSYQNTVLEEYRYSYDLMGNKTEIQKERNAAISCILLPEEIRNGLRDTSGTYHFRYDCLNRLTAVVQNQHMLRTYEYDAFGNRVRHLDQEHHTDQICIYNEMDQLKKNGKESYRYDRRGNLTEIMKEGRLVNGYQYDETNRLSKAADGTGQMSCYQYNGLGNRVGCQIYSREINLRSGLKSQEAVNWEIEEELKPAREADYLLDLTKPYHNLLSKTERNGVAVQRQDYIWDGIVVAMTEGERACIYLQDELGSPVRMLDAHGDYQTVYGYDEFGRDLFGNQGEVQPFGYTGYQTDRVANTYFAQAREYMPGTGRFGGEDVVKGSARLPETLNEYGYCWQNPITMIDLTGKFPQPPTDSKRMPSQKSRSKPSNAARQGDTIPEPIPDIPNPPSDYVKDYWWSSRNCYTYAFDLRGRYNPGEVRGIYLDSLLSYNNITVHDIADLVMDDMVKFEKEVRIVLSKEDKYDDEYIVALRISNGEKIGFPASWDYHFAILLSDGTWADKRGSTASRWNELSDEDIAWLMDGRPFYDSDIVYFAVKKEGVKCENTR